jgi:hypothetical protein
LHGSLRVQYTFCIEHSLPDWLDEARMLSVLLLRAVWRGDADDLGFWFALEGSLTHRQQYPGGVFVFCWSRNEGAVAKW